MRVALLALVASLPATALASPIELTHQGRLLNASGTALNGSHHLGLSLYDSTATSAVPVWTDTFIVDLNDGYFAVAMGSGSPMDHTVFDGTALFLGIAIDAGAELQPRSPVTEAPYAAHARSAINVAGGTVSATQVTVGGTTIDSNGVSVGGSLVINAAGSLVVSPADLGCANGEFLVWGGSSWSCGSELDPAFTASVASGVGSANIADWNEAHGWGDHSGQYIATENDPAFAASAAAGVSSADIATWNEAESWGDHDGQYLPLTGGSVSGSVSARGITVTKNGATSTITFPATVNDAGSIIHEEINNTGTLWLTSSDDWDVSASNDAIVFGDYGTNTRQHVFVGNGNAIHQGNVTVAGETLTAARIASWDRPANGCPSDMERVAAWCIDDAANAAKTHVEAMRGCWNTGRQLCEPEAMFACDDGTGTACDLAMDAPTTEWLWTNQLAADVDDVAWTSSSGSALVTAQTGDNVVNEIEYLNRGNSFEFFCCRNPTN